MVGFFFNQELLHVSICSRKERRKKIIWYELDREAEETEVAVPWWNACLTHVMTKVQSPVLQK